MIEPQQEPQQPRRPTPKRPRIEPEVRPPDVRICDFRDIYKPFTAEMVMAEANRCIDCLDAPCVEACPLHNDIPKWLDLSARGEFLKAAEASRATSNLPEICGRICPNDRLCEEACLLEIKHQPVAIRAIELFINESYIREKGLTAPAVPSKTGKTVAVVGSGPAGLTCADELARRGHSVTVLEAQPQPGGLLIYGIPSFKLEKQVVERRLRYLQELGVEFVCNVRVDEDVSLHELETVCFDAVFIGCGAQKPKRPEIPGIELEGIHDPLPFLIRNGSEGRFLTQQQNQKDDLTGKIVTVFGGGDTAMDCVRTAVRLGADRVICVYRRDEENMPGSRREVEAAKEEGVEFQFYTQPLRFIGNHHGHVRTVECIRMELGEPDAKGRRQPIPVANSNFIVPTDYAILAFGFDVDPVQDKNHPFRLTSGYRYEVDNRNKTNHLRVWAGGNAVRGAGLVTTAVKDGRQAALAIHEYLTGLIPLERPGRTPLERPAEIALHDGAQLLSWWRAMAASGNLKTFPLMPNLPFSEMRAFYDSLEINGQQTSVMGCLQSIQFPRRNVTDWSSSTLDSFVKKEFLSRCAWVNPDGLPGGFGYSPLAYKLKGSGECGRFPTPSGELTFDLSEIGNRYEWIVLRVDIYDFLKGIPSLQKYATRWRKVIKEAAYVAVHEDYFRSAANPPEGAVAESCFGYSFLPCLVEPNFFGFGPGHFGAAIKQFRFLLLESGDLEIELSFIVAPRSQKVLDLWGFDPVYDFIHMINALAFGIFEVEQRAHDKLDGFMLRSHGIVHQNLLEDMRAIWERQNWIAAASKTRRPSRRLRSAVNY